MREVEDIGLSDYVHYLGAIPTDQLRQFSYHAIANLFMYDVSNLGNVFFETYTTGGLVVGKDDGSLDEFPQGVEPTILFPEVAECHWILSDISICKS